MSIPPLQFILDDLIEGKLGGREQPVYRGHRVVQGSPELFLVDGEVDRLPEPEVVEWRPMQVEAEVGLTGTRGGDERQVGVAGHPVAMLQRYVGEIDGAGLQLGKPGECVGDDADGDGIEIPRPAVLDEGLEVPVVLVAGEGQVRAHHPLLEQERAYSDGPAIERLLADSIGLLDIDDTREHRDQNG
ncbi:MAG: hypothetical protein DDT40_01856 [candidate division WS2 bacterium]|nr:hypothetical protein [Candidatus Psychracetigena formicireducens]